MEKMYPVNQWVFCTGCWAAKEELGRGYKSIAPASSFDIYTLSIVPAVRCIALNLPNLLHLYYGKVVELIQANIVVQWNLSFTRENENGHLKTAWFHGFTIIQSQLLKFLCFNFFEIGHLLFLMFTLTIVLCMI